MVLAHRFLREGAQGVAIALKRLTKRQVMVYRLLRDLGGRASTMEIIRLAKERHPNLPVYARVRESLDKLEAKGYVSRDKSRLPCVWVVIKIWKWIEENVLVKLREKEVMP